VNRRWEEKGGKTERKKKAEPRLNREKNREEEKATKGRGDWKTGETETQETRREKRVDLLFPCFFSKKQRRPRRKATSSGGRKQLADQSSITSPFPCFQRGSNTENKNINKQRHRDRKQEINTEETEQRDPNTERKQKEESRRRNRGEEGRLTSQGFAVVSIASSRPGKSFFFSHHFG